ncbi:MULTISPECIES: hypothetical protein [unclassified Microcoleus]
MNKELENKPAEAKEGIKAQIKQKQDQKQRFEYEIKILSRQMGGN